VHAGVVADPPAHPLIAIDSQDVRSFREGKRITSDPGTEVDDQVASEPAGFVMGDGPGGCLLDADWVNTHARAVCEFAGCLLASY